MTTYDITDTNKATELAETVCNANLELAQRKEAMNEAVEELVDFIKMDLLEGRPEEERYSLKFVEDFEAGMRVYVTDLIVLEHRMNILIHEAARVLGQPTSEEGDNAAEKGRI